MQDVKSAPRWPHYERQCREWAAALKQVDGEFQRGPFDIASLLVLLLLVGGTGAWLLWATTIGADRRIERPWNWLLPAQGVVLLVLALVTIWRKVGVRYRIRQGEICEISARGAIRWRESLMTLQSVTFPWQQPRGPQFVRLHWPATRRTIELLPSLAQAVEEVQKRHQPISKASPPELTWRCGRCAESNPDNFEICWNCKAARGK